MKIHSHEPPREFEVGHATKAVIRDCARIALEPDEQITLTTASGAEYDVARKAWGFYATPSINGRLANFGLRTVLVKNPAGRFYVLLVEQGCEAQFDSYAAHEQFVICGWLDDPRVLERFERISIPST
jgi:hypothetical protein